LKALKKEITAAKRTLKALRASFLERLEKATAALSEEECRRLALDIAREDLKAQLDRYVAAHRREIVVSVENWWDKYRVSASKIEFEREELAKELERYLGELGYAR
jgi:type I restriction enzyme M protein